MESEFDRKLIEYVANEKILFDQKNNSFKNKRLKEDIWKNISAKLGKSVIECKLRWRTLRERFSREIRRMSTTNDTSKMWVYYKQMEFLKNYIKQRKYIDYEVQKTEQEDFEEYASNDVSQDSPPKRKKDPLAVEYFEPKEKVKSPRDEKSLNQVFFEMVANMLDDLPDVVQENMRIDIFHLITNARMLHLHNKNVKM